jgi:23S rRNA pseudouridine955/2504/2580 synthase
MVCMNPKPKQDQVVVLSVSAENAGQRLDNWLFTQLKGVPKSHVYRIIRSGEVRVNRGRADQTQRLAGGDQVRIPPIRLPKAAETPRVPAAVFPMIYEDDALLVINKPAGVAVHGGSGVSFGVVEQLRAAHPDWKYLELVHRLDRETSGLLMLAKKRSALVRLHEMLREHSPDKRYLALVRGHWRDEKRAVKLPLFKYTQADGERRVRVQEEGGVPAHTIFHLRQRFADCALLEAELKTGRTHQIRVHLAAIKHPILGDEKYGDFSLNKDLARRGLKRMFLHAARLNLPHPLSGEPLLLEAPLPAELAHYLEHLAHGADV